MSSLDSDKQAELVKSPELTSPVIDETLMEMDRLDSKTLSNLEEWTSKQQESSQEWTGGLADNKSPVRGGLVDERESSHEWSPGDEGETSLWDYREAREIRGTSDIDTEESQSEDQDEDEEEDDDFTDYENAIMVKYQDRVEQGIADDERQCWVCFASEEDDPVAAWVHPCLCKGTTKWVHQVCIQRWVDEKQKGNNSTGVSCPQCGNSYSIQFPPSGPLVRILDALDKLVGRLCPVVAGGVCVGSLYWTCVTYGAVTVMQVSGHEHGLNLMETADPLLLLVSLPLVPLGLVLAKMVRWQEPVLKFLRIYVPLFSLTKFILPAFSTQPESESSSSAASLPPPSDPVSVTRTFCGALFFPTVATFLGSALFEDVRSPVKRAAMGGFCFVGVKGVLKIYHKQNQYVKQSKRLILDYSE